MSPALSGANADQVASGRRGVAGTRLERDVRAGRHGGRELPPRGAGVARVVHARREHARGLVAQHAHRRDADGSGPGSRIADERIERPRHGGRVGAQEHAVDVVASLARGPLDPVVVDRRRVRDGRQHVRLLGHAGDLGPRPQLAVAARADDRPALGGRERQPEADVLERLQRVHGRRRRRRERRLELEHLRLVGRRGERARQQLLALAHRERAAHRHPCDLHGAGRIDHRLVERAGREVRGVVVRCRHGGSRAGA